MGKIHNSMRNNNHSYTFIKASMNVVSAYSSGFSPTSYIYGHHWRDIVVRLLGSIGGPVTLCCDLHQTKKFLGPIHDR